MRIKWIIGCLWLAALHVGGQTISLSPSVQPTQGGNYVAGTLDLSWTMGESVTPTLTAGSNMLSQGFEQPEVDIVTGVISGSPFCGGAAVAVPFTANGFVDAANVFTAELSNSSGSFATPVSIGTTSGVLSGTINAIIPAGTPSGSGYKIRVSGSLPVFAGKECVAVIAVVVCNTNVWLGNTSSWTTGSNWSTGVAPSGCADNCVIPDLAIDPIVSSAVTVGNLEVQSGAQVTLNSNLSVCGNLTGGSGSNGVFAGSSELRLVGSSAQTISGKISVINLRVNNTSTGVVFTGNTEIYTSMVMEDGNVTNSGGTVTLKSTALETAYLDDFTNPATVGTYTGNLTVERYVTNTADGYRDISSPVATTVADLGADYPIFGANGVHCWYSYAPYPNLQYYNETTNSPTSTYYGGYWSYTGYANLLRPMLGLAARTYKGTAFKFDFTGNPYTGNKSVSITKTASATPSADGWNLTGNPYPSPILWTAVKALNAGKTDGSYYVFQTTGEYSGNWGSFNGVAGVNGATNDIASSQGFFVKASATNTFAMSNSVRTTSSGTLFYKTDALLPDEIRLTLNKGTQRDEIVAYSDPTATWGFDSGLDAVKMPAGSTVYMSFKQDTQEYAINVIDSVNVASEFPLVLWARDTGNYAVKATALNLTNLTAYFKDSVTGVLTNLSTDSVLIQLNGKESYENRYSVVFQSTMTTDVTEQKDPLTRIYSIGDRVVVQRSSTEPATVSIANVLGQQITQVVSHQGRLEIPLGGPELWYAFVKVTEGRKVSVAKVLISNK